MSGVRLKIKGLFVAVFPIIAFVILPAGVAATRWDVALIADGQKERLHQLEEVFVRELQALTAGEFDIRFKHINGAWTQQSILNALDQAYRDPDVELVLVTGVVASQLAVIRSEYPKPTFLPLIFNAELLGAPSDGDRSGLPNLNYLADRVEFSEALKSLRRLTPFDNFTLIADQIVLQSVPALVDYVRQRAGEFGASVRFVAHDGRNHDVVSRIPNDTDAVMVAGLPRMPEADFAMLIAEINRASLPSFSLLGSEAVRQGLLASESVSADFTRLARRNALNMQAVMLGEGAGDQPVYFEGKRELTINMATARRIGLSPRFDVLSEAVLLNEEPAPSGPRYSLAAVVARAVEANLDLVAERSGVDAASQDIQTARANLFPQLNAALQHARRNQSPQVQNGAIAERSSDAALSLRQVIYSDSTWANLDIQRKRQLSREAALQALHLDTVQAAAVAYLDVLRAETQVRIQQDNLTLTKTNLELAQNRVRLGSSSAADVFRWESELANARSSVLRARASLKQAREALNRLLHRPLTEAFQVTGVAMEEPFAMTEEEFSRLVENPRDFALFTAFQVRRALALAPELMQHDSQLQAKQRELVTNKRAYWSPDVSLTGQLTDNLRQSGMGVGASEHRSDWNIGIEASLPLFTGGSRKAAVSRVRDELRQLTALREATAERIEQRVRANIHVTEASYANIALSRQSAEAARKNFDLVSDAYAKGVVPVIDMLDAQNASLQAEQAAANAVYDLLIDVMNLQRSVGEFIITLSEAEQQARAQQLREYMNRNKMSDDEPFTETGR